MNIGFEDLKNEKSTDLRSWGFWMLVNSCANCTLWDHICIFILLNCYAQLAHEWTNAQKLLISGQYFLKPFFISLNFSVVQVQSPSTKLENLILCLLAKSQLWGIWCHWRCRITVSNFLKNFMFHASQFQKVGWCWHFMRIYIYAWFNFDRVVRTKENSTRI